MTRSFLFVLAASMCVVSCSGTSAESQSQPPVAAAASRQPVQPAGAFTGAVVETMDSGGYTYMRLQADGQNGRDVWIAATEMSVAKGERLTVPLEMPMEQFHSNTLNRDFPLIYFVSQVAREGESLSSPASAAMPDASRGVPSMPLASHGSGSPISQNQPAKVVPTAPPTGGLSIADVWSRRKELVGKDVTIRGTVVKVNDAILGVNWVHLQDGSGDASRGTNDLTITTEASLKVGDVVTMTGTLAIDKDFTAGYVYDAILEHARVR